MRRVPPFTTERDSEAIYQLLKEGRVYLEYCIRKGIVTPKPGDPTQARWAKEGLVPSSKLETVNAKPR